MITNFEEVTAELTEKELELLPMIVSAFKTKTADNPITAGMIVASTNRHFAVHDIKDRLTEPKLRKYVNYIRSNAIIPLIATSKGYFVSYDPEIIGAQVKSLYERASSIRRCADGLNVFLNPDK